MQGPYQGGNSSAGTDKRGGGYGAYRREQYRNASQGGEAEEEAGEGDSSQFRTPEAPGAAGSLFNTSVSGGRKIHKTRRSGDSGRPSPKGLMSPREAASYSSTDEEGATTPKGVKRLVGVVWLSWISWHYVWLRKKVLVCLNFRSRSVSWSPPLIRASDQYSVQVFELSSELMLKLGAGRLRKCVTFQRYSYRIIYYYSV